MTLIRRHAAKIGYTPEMLAWGFEHMFSHWNRNEMLAFLNQEIAGFRSEDLDEAVCADTSVERRRIIFPGVKYHKLLIVLASTVPSAAFQDVILSLLLPVEVMVRPAENLLPFFEDIYIYLKKKTPKWAQRLTIVDTGHDPDALLNILKSCDIVNVSGSSETISLYRNLIHDHHLHCDMIEHGHRLSAMVLVSDDLKRLTDEVCYNISLDATVWEQMGCLSPKCLYIEADFVQSVDVAQRLIHCMDSLSFELPAVASDISVRVRLNNILSMLILDGAEVIRAHDRHHICIVYPVGSIADPVLLPGVLNLYPVCDAISAAMRLKPYGQAIGTMTPLSAENKYMLAAAGFNYFCVFGKMQDPPLTWLHDSIGTLRPLCLE